MGICWILYRVFLHVLILLICPSFSIKAQSFDYPIANLSTSWTNNPSIENSITFTDGSMVRSILLRGRSGSNFACGFYCDGNCTSFLFAVFIIQTNNTSHIIVTARGSPQVVWSANRYNPVGENATLQLTENGDLILRDFDGTLVWSTNTSGMSVAGLNMTQTGNLVLFERNNSIVWQSFDHPTDSLVPGQKLLVGQRLTAIGIEGSLLSLSVTAAGMLASIESDPPQFYYESRFREYSINSTQESYVRFLNGSLALFVSPAELNGPYSRILFPQATHAQYMKLGSDGHLRVYEWISGWKEVADLLTSYRGDCDYPLVCGKYGICSNGQCSCPGVASTQTSYFRQLSDRLPNLGCSEITPLSCETPQYHIFVHLNDVTYFYYPTSTANTDMESCKQACLKNCSCKAALFRYGTNESNGFCYLPSQLFSLMHNEKRKTLHNSSVFVKVQISSIPSPHGSPPTSAPIGAKINRSTLMSVSILVSFFALFLTVSVLVARYRMKRADNGDEDSLEQVPGLPTRFTFQDLKEATDNFIKKLGEGGFGSVYEGTLDDGTKIAVKRLDGIGQVKKSFSAEVKTIGSTHHVNLVRLVGFCADKSHRLLVYEFMCNGSLDKWIFDKTREPTLTWNRRRKIILDIAKGLAYLHEECRHQIIHLDIKPQNILLDSNFNAKVSDFGLSKLIDGNQSKVVTTMRGTPGYMAPEWLTSKITEKADVYSFGVVVMEIVCGRKNLDRSLLEEDGCLLSLLTRMAEEERLSDIIDKHDEDMERHKVQVLEMIKIAVWCLQSDFARRPSMSVVVKVLEGVKEVEPNLDYNFSIRPIAPLVRTQTEVEFGASTPLMPWILSGAR